MTGPIARAVRSASRLLERVNPFERSRRPYNLHLQADPSWERRATRAVEIWARHRPAGSPSAPLFIADLGCGSERLRVVLDDQLPDPFSYQGYDVQPQQSSTIRLDLQRELPDASFDAVFALGLVEYLPDLDRFLRGVGEISHTLVVSYTVADSPRG